jgi:hypothetical protein
MVKRKSKANKKSFHIIIEKYKPYLIPFSIFAAFFCIVLTLVFLTTGMSFTLTKIIDQSEKNKESLDAVIQTLVLETKYTNDLRSQLGLSEVEYPIASLLSKNNTEENKNDSISYFRAIDKLYSMDNEDLNKGKYNILIQNADLKQFAKDSGLTIILTEQPNVSLIKNDIEYFTITINPDSEKLSIVPYLGNKINDEILNKKTFDQLKTLVKGIDAHSALLANNFLSFKKVQENPSLLKVLNEKELNFSKPEQNQDEYFINIEKKSIQYLKIGFKKRDLSYFIGTEKIASYDTFINRIIKTISELKIQSESEKAIENLQDQINKVFADKGFTTLLKSKKLKVTSTPRNDYYFLYYDITDNAGRKIGSLAIDKFHFGTYLMDKDDVQISSLKALMENPESLVKKN